MNKLLKFITIFIGIYPLHTFALCIGPCTPNYSPMPVTVANTPAFPETKNNLAVKLIETKLQKKKSLQHTNQITKANTEIYSSNVPAKNYASSNIIAINPATSITKYFNSDNPNNYDSANHASNPFNFSLYKPTYILPLYYNFKPDTKVYAGTTTTDGQSVTQAEFDFQISFKVPLWQDIFVWPDTVYAAYTQDSYWQLYTNSPYFRETNYEPEIFLDNEINKPIGGGWELSDLDIGAMHQSNGRGGILERSWNRAYFNTIFTNGNWMVSIQPWTQIFAAESSDEHNPDIGNYMGYGQEMLAYNYDQNTFSFTMRNVLESGFSRGAEWITWSFPLIHRNLKGYVYLFSGYGYDLIDYNHYTNGAGLGVTLNDWM